MEKIIIRLSTQSKNVWIRDIYHKHYPNYVRILEVLPDGYRAQIQTAIGKRVEDGPIEVFKEEQLTDELI